MSGSNQPSPNLICAHLDQLLQRAALPGKDADRLAALRRLFADRTSRSLEEVARELFPDTAPATWGAALRSFRKRFHDAAARVNIPLRILADTSRQGTKRGISFATYGGELTEKDLRPLNAPDNPAYDPATYVPIRSEAFATVTFPDDIDHAFADLACAEWDRLTDDARNFLRGFVCRLQPFVQIAPHAVPASVIGFEALGTTVQGETFGEIMKACARTGIDGGVARLALFRVALRTARTLRDRAEEDGHNWANGPVVSVNLDAELIASPAFERLLHGSRHLLGRHIALEVNEKLPENEANRVLQWRNAYDFDLILDDSNDMKPALRLALAEHVSMSKADVKTFQQLWNGSGGRAPQAVEEMARFRQKGKRFVIEGVETHAQLQFLKRHWDREVYGDLHAQGHIFDLSEPWLRWLAKLPSGLPPGYVLTVPPERRQRRAQQPPPDLDRRLAESLGDRFAPRYAFDEFQSVEVQTEDGSPEDALASTLRWIESEDSTFLGVLGDAGAGKTFLCRMVTKTLLEQRAAGHKARLPIYLDLRHAGHWPDGTVPSIDTLIGDMLTKQRVEIAAARIREEVESGRAVIIFDGLDEKAAFLTDRQSAELMANIRSVAVPRAPAAEDRAPEAKRPSGAKVIIACRTHYFRARPEERARLTGGGPTRTRDGLSLRDFRVVYLRPFDLPRIESYLHKRLGVEAGSAARRVIESVYNLIDLASRPFLLSLLTEHLNMVEERAAAGRGVRVGDLYELMVDEWVARDEGKHLLPPSVKRELMRDLAADLWRKGALTVPFEALYKLVVGSVGAQHPGLGLEQLVRADIDARTATFLVRDAAGNYSFAHRSFLEFFLAEQIYRRLADGDAGALDLPTLAPEVVDFLLDRLLPIGPAAARWIEAVLEARYRERASKNAARISVAWTRRDPATAPAPAVIHLEGARMAGEDLRGVSWPGALLGGADLFGADLSRYERNGDEALVTDLSRADLSGADLRNVHARGACLGAATLRGARLDGADCAGADLARADLTRVRARGTDFFGAALAGACFEQATLTSAGFVTATRGERSLRGAITTRAVGLENASDGPVHAVGPFVRPTCPVAAVCFSPDGTLLASGSDDNTVRLWDPASGKLLRTLKGHDSRVHAVCFSPDGALLASGSSDNTVRLWDPASGKLLRELNGHYTPVRSVCFSPDGALLASGSNDKTVRLWRPASGKFVHALAGHDEGVLSVCFSPDGALLASGSKDKTVRLWDPAAGNLLFKRHHNRSIRSVCFSLDGALLASGSDDHTVKLWDPASGKLHRTLKGHDDSVRSVCFAPDGLLASGSDDHTVKLWDPASGKVVRTLKEHHHSVRSVCFAPDSALLASGSYTVKLWDPASGKLLRTLKGHRNSVGSICFSPDGTLLASGSDNHIVRLWDPASSTLLRTLEGHDDLVSSVCFSPDGQLLASGSDDNTVRLWDPTTGKCLRALGHDDSVRSVCFSPDGQLLASGSDDNTVRLWDPALGTLLFKRRNHNRVSFSPNGPVVVSGSTISLWEPASGTLLRMLSGHDIMSSFALFSPDGLLVFASHDTISLWDPPSGKLLRTLEGRHNSGTCICFSPDGALLASGSNDTVTLWDPASGKLLRTLKGHDDSVSSVCFSPDGKLLASGSQDNTVRLWDPTSATTVAILGDTPGGWWSSAPGRLPEGDAAGLADITYASRDFRAWTGYELRAAAGQGTQFVLAASADATFD